MSALVFQTLLWLGVATASEPTTFTLEVSPETTVEVLPQAQADRQYVLLHRNHRNLTAQLEDRDVRHLLEHSAVDMGGGTWLLALYPSSPHLQVVPALDDERLTLNLNLTTTPFESTPLVTMLDGQARTPQHALRDTPFARQGWTTARETAGLLGASERRWANPALRIPLLRNSLGSRTTPLARDATWYLLAEAHLDRGFDREAVGYLRMIENSDSSWPADDVLLALAEAEGRVGRWHAAREACEAAAVNGAPLRETRACRAWSAVGLKATDEIDLAIDVIATPSSSEAVVLAGELLLLAGRPDLALPALASLSRRPPAATAAWQLILGDALFLTGQFDDAELAWRNIPHLDDNFPIAQERQRLIELHRLRPYEWGQVLPALALTIDAATHTDAGHVRASGAEAHHLAAQVSQLFGHHDQTVAHYQEMLERFPTQGATSEVRRALLTTCERGMAARDGNDLAFFEGCWRPDLMEEVTDTTLLLNTAEVFAQRGFLGRALELTRDAAAWTSLSGADASDVRMTLALRYIDAKLLEDAEDTLKVIRKNRVRDPARLSFVEARLAHAEGRATEAVRRVQAARRGATRSLAKTWEGVFLADAGQCSAALRALQGAETLATTSEHPDPMMLSMLQTECLLATQKSATQASEAMVADIPAIDTPQHMTWLMAASLAGAMPETLDLGELPEVWTAMKQADQSWAGLQEVLEARSN